MAKPKDTGKKPKVVVKAKPVVAVKPAVKAKPKNDDNKRYGTNVSKPVSSVEATRIKEARNNRNVANAAKKPYYSPYDASKGNTEQAGYDDAKNDLKPTPAGGGGGGGGGPNGLDRYTQQLQALLKGGSYADPYKDLQSKLTELYGGAQTDLTNNRNTSLDDLNDLFGDAQSGVDARNKTGLANLQTGYNTATASLGALNTQAGKTINSSMDGLTSMLKAQANPYADLQAENVTPTAQLSSFLQGQNVGDQQTQDYAQVLNAQNAGSAGAFNNLAQFMRGIAGANQQGAIADVEVQRDASTRQLASNNQAYGNQLSQGLLADQLKMGQTYDSNTFDISKGLLDQKSKVNESYDQNRFSYGQNLIKGTADISSSQTTQQNDLIKQMLAAIAKGGKPKKGKLF